MKQLFLCSYFAAVSHLFERFAREKSLTKQVLFIPTAGNPEAYTGYIDEAKQVFRDLGFEIEVLDLASSDQETAKTKMFHSQLLYISGGNTFYLLQELQKKQLLPVIKEQIHAGMVYVGESAGAIITSKDINYNHIMDDKTVASQLSDTIGLGEIELSVLPHMGEFPFVESSQKTLEIYQHKLNLLPLNNQQALWIEGEAFEILTEEGKSIS